MSVHSTAGHIDRAVEREFVQEKRSHLGASLIGRPCERQLYYTFHWAGFERFSGRMLRLFERGQREETVFAKHLKKIGAIVHDVDADGQQFRVMAIDGHFGGSMDGIAQGIPGIDPQEWIVLEFKTHNHKSFTHLETAKSVRKSKPTHWAQMQAYMGLTGLRHALYLAVNKNDDTLYSEFVSFDDEAFNGLIEKARRVIYTSTAPPRISNSPAFFECKYCPFKDVCHFNAEPVKSCRSCRHAMATANGTWTCGFYNQTIPKDFIKKGCPLYEAIRD